MRIPESECPAIWIRRPRSAARNSKPTGYHLKRNVYGHPLACLLWERQFEKILDRKCLGKIFKLRMFIFAPRQKLFPSVCVDDTKMKERRTETHVGHIMVFETPDKIYHQWNKACGKRLARLISCIHFTSGYGQHGNVGNAASECRLCLFPRP